MRYDQNVTNVQRVNRLLDWLRRPASIRPAFATIYFDTVDTIGHRFGPDSAEVNAALAEVDARIGELVDGAQRRARQQQDEFDRSRRNIRQLQRAYAPSREALWQSFS